MRDLSRLLCPRTIAVIGGGVWGGNVISQCRKIGFDGPIYAVHPSRAEVAGVPAVAAVADLPFVPDACFIGVNREASVGVVRQLAALGAGGAVCFASGFAEAGAEIAGAADLQADLLNAAGDMPILGPNCYGLINAVDGAALWPDQHGCTRVARGVAIITQSSNIAINLTMQRRGLPVAYVVTVGNQAMISMAEIGMSLLDDPRVSALGLHIEGFGDVAGFERLARHAYALGKRIIAVKVGASQQARAATISHTASLAGSDAGAAALLARLGVGRAGSLAVMLEALKILHVGGPLASGDIASMSCSGGEASLMADLGQAAALRFPPLDAAQSEGLRASLGPKVALANPLDYHTYIWGDVAGMAACFAAMMAAHIALACVVLDYPRGDMCDAGEWAKVLDAMKIATAATGRRMALLASLPENMPEDVAIACVEAGIVPLAGMETGLAAIALCAGLGAPAAQDVWCVGALGAGHTLREAEAKARLAAHGVVVPLAGLAPSAAEAGALAAQIGFPLVLKGEGVAHKSEAGAVVLGLGSGAAVAEAAGKMGAGAGVRSFLVEEMITGAVAELLVGVVRDPAHGFVLTLGAGGTRSELWRDTQSLLLPVTAADIDAALGRLALAPVLAGYRGGAPAALQAIVDAVLAVQAYVLAEADHIIEAEINPLICTPTRAIAADALIVLGEPV